MSPREYVTATRQPRYSLTFALPLLVSYEVLATTLSQSALDGVRNGADVVLKTLFVSFGGRAGLATFGLAVIVVGAWLVWRDRRSHPGPLRSTVLGAMLLESLVYAGCFGIAASGLTALLLGGVPLAATAIAAPTLPLGTQLVVSLGAGIYEELLFRVLLVSGLTGLGVLIGWRRSFALAVAVAGSALIFSGFHYVGPLGDQLALPSFTFRAIAGLLFSGLYVIRGFGIAAWTHALYDVGLALTVGW